MSDDKILDFDARLFTEAVDTERFGKSSQALYDFLTSLVIGQDRAARLITRALAARAVGLNDPTRPEIIVCPGPSGSGKTYSAEVVARCLIYDDEVDIPYTLIDCSEMTEHHQLSELRGSPPGYVGYAETPRLAQIKIDEAHVFAKLRQFMREHPEVPMRKVMDPAFLANFYRNNGPYTSIICFDEFEKGCKELHRILYGILDKGVMSMARPGDGATSFRNSIIFLTTNVGDKEMLDMLSGQNRPVGFATRSGNAKDMADASHAIYQTTLKKMREIFDGPLIGRMKGRIVVFRPLSRDDLGKIFILMFDKVMKRLRQSPNKTASQIRVAYTPQFREFVLDESASTEFGARDLRQTVERHVAQKLANAIENGGAQPGDNLVFTVTGEGTSRESVLMRLPRPQHRLMGVPPIMATPHGLLPGKTEGPGDKPDPNDPSDKSN